MLKGATMGFALGVAAGAVAGLAQGDKCWFEEGYCYNSTGGNLIMGLTFGAAAFNIITLPAGALLGAVAVPAERWNSVPRPELTLAIVPRKQGGAVALRLRF